MVIAGSVEQRYSLIFFLAWLEMLPQYLKFSIFPNLQQYLVNFAH